MGFHVCWIASRGKAPEELRAQLKLRETPEREEIPESDVTGVLLPSGWYAVVFNDALPPELQDAALKRLSKDSELVAFVVEEASMVSSAHAFARGKRTWSVLHDFSKGPTHLDVSGVPPAHVAAIRERLLAQSQAQENPGDILFDLPAELSKALTGFRHDEAIVGVPAAFTVMERTAPAGGRHGALYLVLALAIAGACIYLAMQL